MPIYENQNTITVGSICLTCGLYLVRECPYENHNIKSALEFKGDIRGKCIYYQMVEENYSVASNKNIQIFQKIASLDQKTQNKMFAYWSYLFPEEYAKEMVTDEVETVQKNFASGNHWYKTAQDLSDYKNNTEREKLDSILNDNQYYQRSNDVKKNDFYRKFRITKLKEAIKRELGITISNLPTEGEQLISFINFLEQNKNQIQTNTNIKGKSFQNFQELEQLLTKEMSLNPEDQMVFNHSDTKFRQWVKNVKYNSGNTPLETLHDYYLNFPSTNLLDFNQEQLSKVANDFHSTLAEKRVDLEEMKKYSKEILRESPNQAQGGETTQAIVLDDISIKSISRNPSFLESVLSVQKNGVHTVELNSEYSLKLEGNRMGHCVGGYGDSVQQERCEIYSLRNNKNEPFATIEMVRNYQNNSFDIVQIKGKGNKLPVDVYRPFVMQWVINNNLKIQKDIRGALVGNMFEKVLEPFESIEKMKEISNVKLGELTPYKKDFIDSKHNVDILVEQTRNNDFLRDLIQSDNYNYLSAIAENENLNEENQLLLLNGMHNKSTYKLLSKRQFLSKKVQEKMLEMSLDSNESFADSFFEHPSLLPEIQMAIYKTMDWPVPQLAQNPNLIPELSFLKGLNGRYLDGSEGKNLIEIPVDKQMEMAKNGTLSLLFALAQYNKLDESVLELIIRKGNFGLIAQIRYQPNLPNWAKTLPNVFNYGEINPVLQKYLMEIEDSDINQMGFRFNTLSQNASLLPTYQKQIFNKFVSIEYLNISIKDYLSKNPDLCSELQSLYGLHDPNVNISEEMQNILSNLNSIILDALARNYSINQETQSKIIQHGSLFGIKSLARNPALVDIFKPLEGVFDEKTPVPDAVFELIKHNQDYNVEQIWMNKTLSEEQKAFFVNRIMQRKYGV